MTAYEARREAFDMGRVVSQTFGAISRNAATFAILALGLVGLPRTLLGLLQAQFMPLGAGGIFNLPPQSWLRMGVLSFVLGLLGVILGALLQAAVIHIVVEDLNGRRGRVADSLSTGLGVAVPVIFLSILIGLGVGFGFILFIVPGLMLATRWIVAVPTRVMERTSIFAAMGRSARLTSGDRWPIFGLMLAFAVVAWVISSVVVGSFATAILASANPVAQLTSPPYMILSALVSAAINTLASAGVAAIYCELRSVKEGVAPSALAAVFD